MAISNFSYDMDIISALSDTPNDTLTAAELKAKFDLGGNKIKEYLNGTVVPAVNQLLGFLANGALDGTKIKAKSIGTSQIDDGAVTQAKIGAGAVTSSRLYDGAVITDKINAAAVTTAKLANGAVTTGKIEDGAVTNAKIGTSAVTNTKIYDGAVTTAKIYDGSVSTAKLADGAVTSAKIADGAVKYAHIGEGAVTSTRIHDDAVTRAKIYDGAVNADKLSSGAVTTAKIASSAVTKDKVDFIATTIQSGSHNTVPTTLAVKNYVDTVLMYKDVEYTPNSGGYVTIPNEADKGHLVDAFVIHSAVGQKVFAFPSFYSVTGASNSRAYIFLLTSNGLELFTDSLLVSGSVVVRFVYKTTASIAMNPIVG